MTVCRKTGFSRAKAIRERERLANQTGRALRIYRCPSCRRFHLTSQPLAPGAQAALGPGERIVDGEILYSASWLNDQVLKPI